MRRQFRLRKRGDFARLREQGRSTSHAWMVVSVLPNILGYNRYGFITSRRVGKAVIRNRVRRILREVTRYHHIHLRQGYDVVFVARQRIVEQSYANVKAHVGKLLEQAGLLRTDG